MGSFLLMAIFSYLGFLGCIALIKIIHEKRKGLKDGNRGLD